MTSLGNSLILVAVCYRSWVVDSAELTVPFPQEIGFVGGEKTADVSGFVIGDVAYGSPDGVSWFADEGPDFFLKELESFSPRRRLSEKTTQEVLLSKTFLYGKLTLVCWSGISIGEVM